MQSYLYSDKFTNKQSEFLCHARGRMLDVKCNYCGSHSDLSCPVCLDKTKDDLQTHLVQWEKLEDNEIMLTKPLSIYDDIFSDNIEKQLLMTRILIGRFEARNKIIKTKTNT